MSDALIAACPIILIKPDAEWLFIILFLMSYSVKA